MRLDVARLTHVHRRIKAAVRRIIAGIATSNSLGDIPWLPTGSRSTTSTRHFLRHPSVEEKILAISFIAGRHEKDPRERTTDTKHVAADVR
jgi:hypothetical protein